MVVNSAGSGARMLRRRVGEGSFLPYTGEYQPVDITREQSTFAANNKARDASSSLTNMAPSGIACREPGAKCQEASSLWTPPPSRMSRISQKRDFKWKM